MRLREIFDKQGGFTLLKRYFKSGVLHTAILQFAILGHSRTALEILRLSVAMKQKQKLYKKYKKKIKRFEEEFNHADKHCNMRNVVWVCWLQGIENAPDIVKNVMNHYNRT